MVLNFDDHGVVTNQVVLGETCTALEMEAGTGIRCSRSTQAAWYLKSNKALINRLPEMDTMARAPAEGQPGTAEMMAGMPSRNRVTASCLCRNNYR